MFLNACMTRDGSWFDKAEAIGSWLITTSLDCASPLQAIQNSMFQKALLIVYSNKLVGNNVMRYAIVIEQSENGFGAYVPDLPGCIAVANSVAETEKLIKEAIEFHLEGMREDGQPIPEASSLAEYVEV